MTPESCPNCGADVPRGAKACPECGSDENTGWSEEARASGLGLPDDSFDHDEFVARELGEDRPGPDRLKTHGIKWHWWAVALVLAALFLFGFLLLRR